MAIGLGNILNSSSNGQWTDMANLTNQTLQYDWWNQANQNSGLGSILGDLGGIRGIADLGMGLGQLFGAYNQYKLGKQALGLAKEQFGFEKALANRNIANQAKIINNSYDNAGQVAAGLIGGRDASGGLASTDPATIARYVEEARKKHVDASAIG